MDYFFKLHGMPTSIVSDKNLTLTIIFWQGLFTIQGTQLNMRITFHPQIDGQMEVINKFLETYLRCFVSKYLYRLAQWLPFFEW